MNDIKTTITRIVDNQYPWMSPDERKEVVEKAMRRLNFRLSRGHKACNSCRQNLKPEAFSKDRRGKDGLAARCKTCESERQRKRAKSK